MGNTTSSRSAPAASSSPTSTDDVLQHLDLSPPSAAVVGSGIAGVHAAYELARLGFRVVVFDALSEIAAGDETQCCSPMVGVGLQQHPPLVQSNLALEVMKSISSAACPDVAMRRGLFPAMMDPSFMRWLVGRHRSQQSRDEVSRFSDNLSCLSVAVVQEMQREHHELQAHILTQHVQVGRVEPRTSSPSSSSSQTRSLVWQPTRTAHPSPMMIDPVGWTRGVARICAERYNVRFVLGERVLGCQTHLRYDVESAQSLTTVRPHPTKTNEIVTSHHRFDVVVLAAGAETSHVARSSTPLPIIGLTGWSAIFPQTCALPDALEKALASLFPGVDDHHDAVGGASLTQLSERCGLRGFARRVGDGQRPEYRISGLMSVENIHGTTTRSAMLEKLAANIQVASGVALPAWSEKLLGSSSSSSSCVAEPHVQRYRRSFTPDGLPFIDHCGGAFNNFVCCGFGDSAADFAPGAGKILAKLVELQAEVLLEEDHAHYQRQLTTTSEDGATANTIKKTNMPVGSALPPSRTAVVEEQLQMLLNGQLPNTSSSSSSSSSAPSEMLHFAVNPFSTNRLSHMVAKQIHDTNPRSIFNRLHEAETILMRKMEPMNHYINREAIKLARRDNVPEWVRNFIFANFFDALDDEEVLHDQHQQHYNMQALVNSYEASKQKEAALSSTQRSTELDMQARSLFK